MSIERLQQLRRNEALQPLDDSRQALCLIGKVVHHREYPLTLLETSSSGTIATLLPSEGGWGVWEVLMGEKSCVYFDQCLTPPLAFAHTETYHDITQTFLLNPLFI